jgi:hypothetical protein
MIESVYSNSNYITVSGGSPSNPYISPGAVGAGMVRWNPNMQCLEVNDGNTWLTFSQSHVGIDLSPETQMLLNWARQKMAEEQKLEAMMERYPALKKAKDNLDMMLNIVKDDFHEM